MPSTKRERMPEGRGMSGRLVMFMGSAFRSPHDEEARSWQRTCAVRCAVSNHGSKVSLILRDARKGALPRMRIACEASGGWVHDIPQSRDTAPHLHRRRYLRPIFVAQMPLHQLAGG